MKKTILYAILLLASIQESRAMFWHHKDKAVPKSDAALKIKAAIDTILHTKPANTYDHHYDGWVMRDIWHRIENALNNKEVVAINNDLFIVMMGNLKTIAHKRNAQLSKTSIKPIKLPGNLIAPCSSVPEYTTQNFKKTKFYEQYCSKIEKRDHKIAQKLKNDDISETMADSINGNQTSAHQSGDAGTNSADGSESSSPDGSEHHTAIDQSCDDDQTGQIIAAVQHAGELDQDDQSLQAHPFIQTLLNNRLAVSGGIAAIAFILYKYKNRIQEFLFPSDTMQVVEAPAPTQTEPIPNEEIAQTLEQLKQMLAKKGK